MEHENIIPESNRTPHPGSDPRPAYSTRKRELLFGIGIVICSLSLGNFLLYGGINLGLALAASGSILLSAGYLWFSGARGDWYSRCLLILSLIIALGFGYSDDSFVKLVLLMFLMVAVNLGLCLTAGQNRHPVGAVSTLLDAGRTLFSLGVGKLSPALRGIILVFRNGSPMSRRSGAVLLGLVISVPALAVVIPLLISADAAFAGLLDLLPAFDLEELFLTVIFGGCFFCILYTRALALCQEDAPQPASDEAGKLSALTVNTALGAVGAVYLAYLFSQLAYFVGGFAGILPEGYSPAQYARRGFFEMAWLSAINLSIMALAVRMVAKKPNTPRSTRIFCLFLGAVTEFLVFSATAKMLLYIDAYGLTRLRVLTMVILVFLGITTALVSVWLFLPRLPYMKAVLLTALILGAMVLWLDVDSLVAGYNVTHYLSGDLESLDVSYLGRLGSGAVPYLVQLADTGSEEAREILGYSYLPMPDDFRSWNYLLSRAIELIHR